MNKDELLTEYHEACELFEHFSALDEKTMRLSDKILKDGIVTIKLIELRVSELFSLYNNAKLYLSIKEHLNHYEFSSLLTFWKDLYSEIVSVARDSDQNTSWLQERLDNYAAQYNVVQEMLKSKISDMKNAIK